MVIKPFLLVDIEKVKNFTDEEIGQGYYSFLQLQEAQKKSIVVGSNSSFLLVDEKNHQVKGLRLAFPPGNWHRGKGKNLRDDLWPHLLKNSAYFQSLFLAKDVQGQGWGPKLSEKSIAVFKDLGAKGIATHCWKESPSNSSLKYLEKVGFKKIIEHPLYWFEVDYNCPIDGYPCRCTAIEMYLTL